MNRILKCWLPALMAIVLISACGNGIGKGDLNWQELTAPHSRYMDGDGYKLHYLDMGQGRPVVMIHGFADSTYCWHANTEALTKAGLRVILVDQPGLGKSGAPPAPYQYTIENQAAAILNLCDHLGLDRFSLAGSSLGGGIALFLAWRHPERVARVALLDPACYEPPGIRWMALPGADLLASALGGRWSTGRSLKSAYFNDKLLTDAAIDEYARPTERPGYFKVLHLLSSHYFSPAFYKMTESYGQIKAPVRIIWGEQDTWIPPEYGRRLQGALPGSKLDIIKDAGHFPHQENPKAVNGLLVGFFTASNP